MPLRLTWDGGGEGARGGEEVEGTVPGDTSPYITLRDHKDPSSFIHSFKQRIWGKPDKYGFCFQNWNQL